MPAHRLKVHPQTFGEIMAGGKTYEFRRDDRIPPFATGDIIYLEEWDPTKAVYTGRILTAWAGYIGRGPEYGIPDGYAILSLLNVHRGNIIVNERESSHAPSPESEKTTGT